MAVIIYCKSHRRRPLRLGTAPFFRDLQADYPFTWCRSCGSEVFDRGQEQCIRCRDTKGEV